MCFRNDLFHRTTAFGSSGAYPTAIFFAGFSNALCGILTRAHAACQPGQSQIFFESRHAITLNRRVASVDKQILWLYDLIDFVGR